MDELDFIAVYRSAISLGSLGQFILAHKTDGVGFDPENIFDVEPAAWEAVMELALALDCPSTIGCIQRYSEALDAYRKYETSLPRRPKSLTIKNAEDTKVLSNTLHDLKGDHDGRKKCFEKVFLRLEHLRVVIEDEFRSKSFLYMTMKARHLYFNPTDGWEAVIALWPDTEYDIKHASQCLALDQWTGSVFHLGRIAERGLREACVKHIPNDLPNPPGQPMGKYLMAIDKVLVSTKPPTPVPLIGLGAAAAHFARVKNVWRDEVTHAGVKFDGDEAKRCYDAVHDMLIECAKIL